MNRPNTRVDFFHHIAIAPAQTVTGEGIAAKQRCMRHGIRQIKKKRPARATLNKVHGGICRALSQQGLVRGLLDAVRETLIGRLAKHQRRSKVFGLGIRVLCTAPGIDRCLLSRITAHTELHQILKVRLTHPIHVIGIRHTDPFIKTMARGQRVRRIAQMPLAEHARGVAAVAQGFRQGDL